MQEGSSKYFLLQVTLKKQEGSSNYFLLQVTLKKPKLLRGTSCVKTGTRSGSETGESNAPTPAKQRK